MLVLLPETNYRLIENISLQINIFLFNSSFEGYWIKREFELLNRVIVKKLIHFRLRFFIGRFLISLIFNFSLLMLFSFVFFLIISVDNLILSLSCYLLLLLLWDSWCNGLLTALAWNHDSLSTCKVNVKSMMFVVFSKSILDFSCL